jgi:2-hydroxychromene-2-carboxylate isomerase
VATIGTFVRHSNGKINPEVFPVRMLEVQRALCALQMERPDVLPDALAVLYHALWVEHRQINKPEISISLLTQVLKGSQETAKELLVKGASPEAKALLTKNTNLAFEQGPFGLPWFCW